MSRRTKTWMKNGNRYLSCNQLIATAVAEKISALMTEDYLEQRAKRGKRKDYEAVLAKVPDVEPEERDRV